MAIFLDCETTGVNPLTSEIIEAYFALQDYKGDIIDSYHYKAKVNKWCDQAAEIHKIPYSTMISYPDKEKAIDDLLAWLPNEFDITIYVNPNTELGKVYFDKAILENEVMLTKDIMFSGSMPFKIHKIYNVYELAKEAWKKNAFTPIKSDKGRASFSQENVYKALFNETYKAHNCVDDVNALIRIYQKLENVSSKSKSQDSLLLI